MGSALAGALKPVVISGGGSSDTGSTAASATGGNGGGGGGGTSDKDQYYMIYKAVCQQLGIPLNKKVAAMAYKTRQPGSGFLSLLKKFDPNYLKTDDFKNRAAEFVAKWKEILPWVKVDYNDMKKFVRGDYNTDRTEQVIMRTKAFKKAYPYFEYGKDDFRTYQAHDTALRNNFAAAGLGEYGKHQQEVFHRLDMTDAEVEQRIEELTTGHGAVDMMFGNDQIRGTKRRDDYIFNTPGNLARRRILQDAVKSQQQLNQSQIAGAQLRRDERGKIIQTGI